MVILIFDFYVNLISPCEMSAVIPRNYLTASFSSLKYCITLCIIYISRFNKLRVNRDIIGVCAAASARPVVVCGDFTSAPETSRLLSRGSDRSTASQHHVSDVWAINVLFELHSVE